MATIPEALAIAIRHHQGGGLQAAEQIYRQILAVEPDHVVAIHFLGVIAHQGGKTAEAIACYRRALELKPDYAEAHNNLGIVLKTQGKLDEAIACYRRALDLRPDYAEACNNLGIALKQQGRGDEAIACYRRVLDLRPDLAGVWNNLGIALTEQGRLDEAKACYRRALELMPDFAEAHNNLGVVWQDQAQPDEATACYRRAVELKPDYAEAHNNLGNVLKDRGKLDEAVASYRRALELKPDYAQAHSNLGAAFKEVGKLDEAMVCYRRALEWKPDFAEAHSNLLYTMVFSPGYDAQSLYEEHRRWDRTHADHDHDHGYMVPGMVPALAKFIRPHPNDRSPHRRLRLGYVSPDFRSHCQAFFTVPLFSAHDHENFEIVCYADVVRPDAVTQRLRSCADVWRSTTGLDDEQVAQAIRRDEIDVLVDLTMHMGRNRLPVFARKPAPVQACWLAYPGTTGLSAMDYRITDRYLDPPDAEQRSEVRGQRSATRPPTSDLRPLSHGPYTEESIRLPDSFWCYDPLDDLTTVNALPAAEKGYISFGCLNNFCKVNPFVLKLWAGVLKAVAGSRLTILAAEGTHRRYVLDLLATEGVAADRITFVAQQPRPQYLACYHGIDIGLDTVPYNGHTTSLDSFWMGVPVVTLVWPTVVGRAGLSQLMNLGLPELIADHDHGYMVPDLVPGPEQYVRIAADLAADLPRLSGLRKTLRQRMQASPLMDAPRFARNIEAAYREMWRRWCSEG